MYVYLKRGKTIKRLKKVILSDCYQPKVDGVTVEKIEPALWFKVLFLDSLFVDCDSRDVSWNKGTSVEAETIHETKDEELDVETILSFFKNKGKIFEGEGCYDFDIFVDELFDTASSIVGELEENETKPDEKNLYQTKQKLLQLLHVFILPALKLRESELHDLQTALSWIEHKHQSIETLIQKKDKTKYNVENSLREQRTRLLMNNDFSSQQYVATCGNDFLELFLKHLQKDIVSLNDKLLEYDREIKPLRDSAGKEEAKKLSRWRAERDNTLAYIDKAIEARETIKNVVGRPHVLKKIKLAKRRQSQQFHVLYVDIANKLSEMTKEIQELIKTKIKVSSVREATLLAIAEITEDGQSYGYERKAGTFECETDIYDPKNKPDEWATLSEKIADLLKAKPLGYRDSHEKFCERIRMKCQSLLDESKLFTSSFQHPGPVVDSAPNNLTASVPISPSTAQVLNILGQESVERRSARSGSYSFSLSRRDAIRSAASRSYSTRFSFGSIPREATEAICKDVIAHISEMAENLAVELYKTNLSQIHRSVLNKIYICYESHISEELMPVLEDLYEQSYRRQCEGLSRWISSFSLSDIGFDDKKFEMLVTPPKMKRPVAECSTPVPIPSDETEVKVPIDSDRKTLSLDEIANLNVDDLYKYSNMEHTERQSIVSCAPGMSGWVEINCESENGIATDISVFDHENEEVSFSETADTGAIETDAVFDNRNTDTKAGISPTDCAMHFAENFMETLHERRRKSARISERKEFNDETEETGGSTKSEGVEGLPSYEEVVMRRRTPPPEYKEVSPIRAMFYETFEMFETILRKETEAVSLFKKLRVMTKAIQYIEKEISNLRGESGVAVCADDILDIVILLISRLDPDTLLKVYSHMNLMIHLSPRFMHGNAHDYALVTFNVAYQHMFEQHVLHKSPKY